jgi:acetylornithine deacetylase/succinyl-diaminopimelate desuccinylase-like protein
MTSGAATPTRDAALQRLEERFEEFQQTLADLVRIPSVSAAGFPAEPVRRSAEAFAALLERVGIGNVRILELPGVHPYVYGEWLGRPGAPTLLLYGHHDVVPPGREGEWRSPPFEPVARGGRLYGRGSADDKGGILAHVAAVAAYLDAAGTLPCNVRFLVEGEEEIGSTHLGAFLEAYAGMLSADAVVLSDTQNFDTGVPGLTVSLRGLCIVDVEVRCLDRPVHSGQKGGAVPDAVQVLCGLIAGLTEGDGSLRVSGLNERIPPLPETERERLRALPFDETAFRRAAGLLEGVALAGDPGYSVYERLWTRPSLSVIAFEAQPFHGAASKIGEAARARLSLRTPAGIDAREAGDLLIADLTRDVPCAAHVKARVVTSAPAWRTDPRGPAYGAARRALAAGYGREAAVIGVGGSIGFVEPISRFLRGAPCLLTGVEDPACNAHSENESLDIADWRKCMRSAVHLYDELSRLSP